MLLTGQNGHRLELELLGYQFPTIEDDEWDSNWLNIRVSATNEQGSWSATDPSLGTVEVAQLADWLEAIAERKEPARDLEFIEPNLVFELVERNESVRLRAWFELELRPQWSPADEVPARDLCVELELAAQYGASAETETTDFAQVYPRFAPSRPERPSYREQLPLVTTDTGRG